MIQSLPEDSTADDIMDELFFRIHVNRGLQELGEGKGIDHSEIKKGYHSGLQNNRFFFILPSMNKIQCK